jgi:hypothetical protein
MMPAHSERGQQARFIGKTVLYAFAPASNDLDIVVRVLQPIRLRLRATRVILTRRSANCRSFCVRREMRQRHSDPVGSLMTSF